jgi:hypothetical protein
LAPPDFSTWWGPWRVYRTALLLLEVSPSEPLDLYGEHIRTLSEIYGHISWPIVYLADVRMRSEGFERTLRRAHLAYDTSTAQGLPGPEGFKPERPWGYIFLQSVHTSNHYATAFWAAEVEKKCLLFQCRLKTEAELMADGTVASSHRGAGSSSHAEGPRGQKRGRKPGRTNSGSRARTSKSTPRGDNRATSTSARGYGQQSTDDTCRDFNRGLCTGKPCKNGYTHRCALCRKIGHPALDCFQATPEQKARFAPKGKGKGKTKHSKAS